MFQPAGVGEDASPSPASLWRGEGGGTYADSAGRPRVCSRSSVVVAARHARSTSTDDRRRVRVDGEGAGAGAGRSA